MLNEQSFNVALRVFNKTRSSIVGCLMAAIEAFKIEEDRHIYIENSHLGFSIIDTDCGLGLVVTGFKSEDDIIMFVSGRISNQ